MRVLPQFSVTTPADDLTLLTPEERRVAAGLDRNDISQDATLAEHEAEIAAEIASDCAVASDGVNPPTLRSEECSDIFRMCGQASGLYLSRRHVSGIASIELDGAELEEDTDWRLDAEIGKVVRIGTADEDAWWSGKKIEVAYVAGFEIVPAELKAEAKSRMKIKASEASRDPLVRTNRVRTEIPDIELREVITDYQVGGLSRLSTSDNSLSPESERRLRRFMTQSMVG